MTRRTPEKALREMKMKKAARARRMVLAQTEVAKVATWSARPREKKTKEKEQHLQCQPRHHVHGTRRYAAEHWASAAVCVKLVQNFRYQFAFQSSMNKEEKKTKLMHHVALHKAAWELHNVVQKWSAAAVRKRMSSPHKRSSTRSCRH